MEINVERGLGIGGLILTLVLLVLDKAGKLKGPVLIGLLVLAGLMTLPLAWSLVPDLSNAWKWWCRCATTAFVLLLYSALILWIIPSPNEQPFAAEIRSSLVSDNGPLTQFMVAYPTILGPTTSPVFYLAFIQVTNLQDIPATITDLRISASKDRQGPWEDLIHIPLDNTTLVDLGVAHPYPKVMRFGRGSYRLGTAPDRKDMKAAAIVQVRPTLLGHELKKQIAPHATIRGWVALDSLRKVGLSPGQIFFRLTISDSTTKPPSVLIAELPRRAPGENSMDIDCGEIEVVGSVMDISRFNFKYYGVPLGSH